MTAANPAWREREQRALILARSENWRPDNRTGSYKKMDRVPVVSSVIAEVGYSESLRTLEIVFNSGAVYLYYFVPQDVRDALMSADSKGTYFNKHIKGVFEHHQIAEPYDKPGKPRKKPRKPGGAQRPGGHRRKSGPGNSASRDLHP
jgi:KTSC domain